VKLNHTTSGRLNRFFERKLDGGKETSIDWHYHIGSGAIESANKFISHGTNANNILKLRCAKYNKTYDDANLQAE